MTPKQFAIIYLFIVVLVFYYMYLVEKGKRLKAEIALGEYEQEKMFNDALGVDSRPVIIRMVKSDLPIESKLENIKSKIQKVGIKPKKVKIKKSKKDIV